MIKFIKHSIGLPRKVVAYIYHSIAHNNEAMYRNLNDMWYVYPRPHRIEFKLAKLANSIGMSSSSLKHLNRAIRKCNDSVAEYHLLKSDIFYNLGYKNRTVSQLEKFFQIRGNKFVSVSVKNKYGLRLLDIGRWEESIDALSGSIDDDSSQAYIAEILADTLYDAKRYKTAIRYYRVAISSHEAGSKDVADLYYKLGQAQYRHGEIKDANESFDRVLRSGTKYNTDVYGIGSVHMAYSNWEWAIESLRDVIPGGEVSTYDMLAEAYRGIYDYESAIYTYKEALRSSYVDADRHFRVAECYESMGDWGNAVKYYRNAVDRQNRHRPDWYSRLAAALSRCGLEKEAIEAYSRGALYHKPANVTRKIYEENINTPEVRYAIAYQKYKVDSESIVFESFASSTMSDNPYAIFIRMASDPRFKTFKFIWVLNTDTDIPDNVLSMENLYIVHRGTDLYFRYISSAKYIITNSKFTKWFTRKYDQKLLNTWHGTAYKHVGKDVKSSVLGFNNSNRVFTASTHISTPNPFMSDLQPRAYQYVDFYKGSMAETGYPRVDMTVGATKEQKTKMLRTLEIKPERMTVLYAPTWRGTYSNNKFDSGRLKADLERLSRLDANILFRGHHLAERHLKDINIPGVRVVPYSINTNRLLSIVDILVTDYSSIFFDFLSLDRPIVHYMYDYDEYSSERGLYLDKKELPGDIASTIDEAVGFIEKKLNKNFKPTSRHSRAKDIFSPHEDGRSTERVIDWFIFDKKNNLKMVDTGSRPTKLVYGGDFTDVDRVNRLIKYLNSQDSVRYNLKVIVPLSVSKSDDALDSLSRLPDFITILPYTSGMTTTLEERAAIDHYNVEGEFASSSMEMLYRGAFRREYRRLCGDGMPEESVDLVGDSIFWSSFLEASRGD